MSFVFNAFFFLLLASPVLWMVSVLLLLDWRRFCGFFLLNLALLASYLWLLISTNLIVQDGGGYGLTRLFAVAVAVVLHVVLGFGFAVGFRLRHARSHS